MTFQGTSRDDSAPPTEYTSWINLSDLAKFMRRTYDAFGYTSFDLKKLSESKEVLVAFVGKLDPLGGDGTDRMMPASAL